MKTLTACPRCHRPLELESETALEPELAARLAKLVLCDHCQPLHWKTQPLRPTTGQGNAEARRPYKDD